MKTNPRERKTAGIPGSIGHPALSLVRGALKDKFFRDTFSQYHAFLIRGLFVDQTSGNTGFDVYDLSAGEDVTIGDFGVPRYSELRDLGGLVEINPKEGLTPNEAYNLAHYEANKARIPKLVSFAPEDQ